MGDLSALSGPFSFWVGVLIGVLSAYVVAHIVDAIGDWLDRKK